MIKLFSAINKYNTQIYVYGSFVLHCFIHQCHLMDDVCTDMLNLFKHYYRPLSRRLDRCDRVIQNESIDPFGGNVYYVTMQITFLTRKFRNGERNLHCDVVHITTKWVSSLTLDCNGVFAIKAYAGLLWSFGSDGS